MFRKDEIDQLFSYTGSIYDWLLIAINDKGFRDIETISDFKEERIDSLKAKYGDRDFATKIQLNNEQFDGISNDEFRNLVKIIENKNRLERKGVKNNLVFQRDFSASNSSHSLMVIKKGIKPAPKKEFFQIFLGESKRNHKEWLGKLDNVDSIYIETITQEFHALICDPNRDYQPKTRIAKHPSEESLILLSEKKDFTPLSKMNKEYFQESVRNGKFTGVGNASVMAFYFAESDRHLDNIGINKKNNIICIDQGSHGLKANIHYEPSAKTLSELPYLGMDSSYQPNNYFQLYNQSSRDEKNSFVTKQMATDPAIQREKNITLMKLITNPDLLINKFMDSYPVDPKKNEFFCQWFSNRNKKFKHAALQMEEFRNYLLTGEANKELEKYIKQLQTFTTDKHNTLLATDDKKIIAALRESFTNLKTTAKLINEIIKNENNSIKVKAIIKENREMLQDIGWVPLYIAAEKNHPTILKACLDEKPDFDTVIVSARTPIQLASQAGHHELIQQLGSNAKIISLEKQSSMSISLAALNHHWPIIDTLLDLKIPINSTVDPNSFLFYVVRTGNAEKVLEFIKKGAIANSNKNSQTELIEAAINGSSDVIKILCEKSQEIKLIWKAVNHDGESALMIAARKGHTEIVKLICEHMPESSLLNLLNKNGWSTLHIAAENGHTEIVKLLCEEAKKNKLNIMAKKDSLTAFHIAVLHGQTEVVKIFCEGAKETQLNVNVVNNAGSTALHLAAENDKQDILKLLLLESKRIGFDVNATNNTGSTAFHLSAEYGRKDIVKIFCLTAKKTLLDFNAINNDGFTALAIAIKKDQEDIVQQLCEEAKNIGLNVNLRNPKDGTTPLYLAVNSGSLHLAKMLLDAKADINAKVDGSTPLECAMRKPDFKMIKLLLEHGAEVKLDSITDPKLNKFVTLEYKKSTRAPINEHTLALENKLSESKIVINGKLNPDSLLFAVKTGLPDIVRETISRGSILQTNGIELHTAAENGYAEIVSLLLENAKKIKLNINTFAYTPYETLRDAVDNNHFDVVKLLCEQAESLQLDIYKKDYENCTLLSLSHNPRIVQFFCEKGLNVNNITSYGTTSLGDAIKSQNFEIAKILLDSKADVNLIFTDFDTQNELSPIELAIQQSDFQMIKLLLEYGAEVKINIISDPEIKAFITLQLLAQHILTFPWQPKRPDLCFEQEKYITQQSLDEKPKWTTVLQNVMTMARENKPEKSSPIQQLSHFSTYDTNREQLNEYLSYFSSTETLEDVLSKSQAELLKKVFNT
jgi:ankyrin repeat protein